MTRRFPRVAVALLAGCLPRLASSQSRVAVLPTHSPSKDVIYRMANLIHVNRQTPQSEPALARSWTVSPDGRLPIVPLASPHVLVGAGRGLGNLRPTVFDHHALWNVDELFWRGGPRGASR
jgi:hypothetical protein